MKKLFLILYLLLTGAHTYATSVVTADTMRLREHLIALTTTAAPRNHHNQQALHAAADYIVAAFNKLPGKVTEQIYKADGKEYRNIILSVGPEEAPHLIVGAHYDVCGDQPGADDNASGIAGLLELAYMLQPHNLPFRIDFVAYTLEEPPYFRTEHMGSFIHAQSLYQEQANVLGMVSLEMIGYFSDEKGSQSYPFKPMKLLYGSKGNYIALVQKFGNGSFGRKFNRLYKAHAPLRVKSLKAPAAIPGIDFSDHLNYWRFGYSALMLTDTAFYRNKNYHEPTDTIDTLDLSRLAQVVEGAFQAIVHL